MTTIIKQEIKEDHIKSLLEIPLVRKEYIGAKHKLNHPYLSSVQREAIKSLPKYTIKEVFGVDKIVDDSPDFTVPEIEQWFILITKKDHILVNTEGFSYARYQTILSDRNVERIWG